MTVYDVMDRTNDYYVSQQLKNLLSRRRRRRCRLSRDRFFLHGSAWQQRSQLAVQRSQEHRDSVEILAFETAYRPHTPFHHITLYANVRRASDPHR